MLVIPYCDLIINTNLTFGHTCAYSLVIVLSTRVINVSHLLANATFLDMPSFMSQFFPYKLPGSPLVSASSPPSSNSTSSNPLLVLFPTAQNFQNANDTTDLLPNASLQCDTTNSSAVAVSSPIVGSIPQNTHPMTTRAKAGVFKPKTYASYKEGSYDYTFEPHTVKESMAKPECSKL